MGPHDLLCRWCSTFVGKDKKFCSIFCESRFTRSKRRKLAIKRPVQSGYRPGGHSPESPRTSKTSFTKKEHFLDDVISAMAVVADKSEEKDRVGRLLGDMSEEQEEGAKSTFVRKRNIPRLDLNSARKDSKIGINSARKSEDDKPEMFKSKTRTIMKNRANSKLPIITHTKTDQKGSNVKSPNNENKENTHAKQDAANKRAEKLDKDAVKQSETKTRTTTKPMPIDNDAKEKVPEFGVPAPITKTRSALDLEHRVRSSGYAAVANPKVRPVSLKQRSASFITQNKRQSSASSVKSNTTAELGPKKLESLPDLIKETSVQRPTGKPTGKWESFPKTIEEETNRTVKEFLNTSLDEQTPTSLPRRKTTLKNSETSRSELDILREESTASDLLDTSQIQDRLSSIKRKVEVRRRGRDSRSSAGSDLDSFLDSSMDLTTDRDIMNNSTIKSKALSARISARTNITRISKSFGSNKELT